MSCCACLDFCGVKTRKDAFVTCHGEIHIEMSVKELESCHCIALPLKLRTKICGVMNI